MLACNVAHCLIATIKCEVAGNVIILFYYNDLPIKEISAVAGIKESTVKSLLKRSREKLKQKLGDEWIYEE